VRKKRKRANKARPLRLLRAAALIPVLDMANLNEMVLMSLDGYIATRNANFDWVELDQEMLSFINEFVRNDGT
jgi:hypothetical protein